MADKRNGMVVKYCQIPDFEEVNCKFISKMSSDLTKLTLNNKIVEMRKDVRQARVHAISKLCKEIRKLKAKSGTEEQQKKNANKAEKFVQQLMFMKKIKDDEIAKFALKNEKSMIEITNDINESLETKALARLTNQKNLIDKVTAFRNTYPGWKESIECLLSTLGEKYKDKKAKKANTSSQAKTKNKNANTKKISQPRKSITNSSGIWFVEEVKSAPDHKNQHSKTLNRDKSVENTNKNNAELIKKDLVEENGTKAPKKVQKSEPKATKQIKSNETKIEPLKNSIKDEIMRSPQETSEPAAAADPFFMTKDNREYMSISIKKDAEQAEEVRTNGFEKGENFSSFKPAGNRRERRAKLNLNNEKRFTNHNRKEDSRFGKPRRELKNEGPAPLHPSWEAKKKLTSGIQTCKFQGKKIKFDE